MFKKYHYLNTSLNNSAQIFILTINGNICGFISYIHFLHYRKLNTKSVHRLVILPEYQGLNLSLVLLDFLGNYLKSKNEKLILTTSNLGLKYLLKKSLTWRCTHIGRLLNRQNHKLKKSSSTNRITTSWEFK